jgi:uncharacterized membrane protein
VYWHHGGLFLGWLLGVVFLVLLIALAVYVVGGLTRGHGASHPAGSPGLVQPDDPLSILRLRYARGEIGRDEFVRANEDLGGGRIGNDPT